MGWARRAPRQPAPRTSGRAARLPARSSPPIAAGQRASGRPRRHSVASAAAAALVARRPICTWWAMHTPAAHRPRGAGSSFVMNSRATRRAGELAAADPANRARLARRLQLAARRRPEKSRRGSPFGVELERAIAHGVVGGRGSAPCADTAPDRRLRTWCHAYALGVTTASFGVGSWCHVGNTSWLALGPSKS